MEDIEYQLMAKLQKTHWWFKARRDIITKVIASLKLPQNASILEVGCGMGGNIAMLAGFGNVYALDVKETAVEYSKSLGLAKEVHKVMIPDENMQAISSRKYDLVVMFDVLEHIDEPNKVLDAIQPLLNSGGKLIVTVPAFQFLWSQHDVSQHHKRRYIKPELESTLLASGFKPEFTSYFNFFLFPLIAGFRLGNKLRPNKNNTAESDLKETGFALNQLLYKIFSLESKLLPKLKLPFGVSLIAVCGCKGK